MCYVFLAIFFFMSLKIKRKKLKPCHQGLLKKIFINLSTNENLICYFSPAFPSILSIFFSTTLLTLSNSFLKSTKLPPCFPFGNCFSNSSIGWVRNISYSVEMLLCTSFEYCNFLRRSISSNSSFFISSSFSFFVSSSSNTLFIFSCFRISFLKL